MNTATTLIHQPEPTGPIDKRRSPQLALTILYHPDLSRIGERAWFEPRDQTISLSRATRFAKPETPLDVHSLRDLRIHYSKPSELLFSLSSGLDLETAHDDDRLLVWSRGEPLRAASHASQGALEHDLVMVELGRQVLLRAHYVQRRDHDREQAGLLGVSDEIAGVREQIHKIAQLKHRVTVLVRGESGVGKERVAQALHALSPRGERPLTAVNLAAVQAAAAAAALFGHTRGAFTGADRVSPGYFGDADRSTLFLDEIGLIPLALQSALLRVLENGERQAVGATKPSQCDVTVVAATDADLEASVQAGTFHKPLLNRLKQFTILVPPLRERREDIPFLFARFLREAAARQDRPWEPDASWTSRHGPRPRAWISLDVMRYLVLCDWEENVRGLSNLATQLVTLHSDAPAVGLEDVKRLLGHSGAAASLSVRASLATRLDFAAVYEQNDFIISRTRKALGISENTFRKWLTANGYPTAKQLTPERIRGAARSADPLDEATVARALRVSERALKLRLNALETDLDALVAAGDS